MMIVTISLPDGILNASAVAGEAMTGGSFGAC